MINKQRKAKQIKKKLPGSHVPIPTKAGSVSSTPRHIDADEFQ